MHLGFGQGGRNTQYLPAPLRVDPYGDEDGQVPDAPVPAHLLVLRVPEHVRVRPKGPVPEGVQLSDIGRERVEMSDAGVYRCRRSTRSRPGTPVCRQP